MSGTPEALGLAFPHDDDWIISFVFDDLSVIRRRVSDGNRTAESAAVIAKTTLPLGSIPVREWSSRRAGDKRLLWTT